MTDPTPTPDAPAPDPRADLRQRIFDILEHSLSVMKARTTIPSNDWVHARVISIMTLVDKFTEDTAALRAERDEAQPVASVAWRHRQGGTWVYTESIAERNAWVASGRVTAIEALRVNAHPSATSPGAARQVGCEDDDCLLIVHDERDTCKVCTEATSPGAVGDAPTVTTWRLAIEGLLAEWDKLTRYGSPMARQANEAVAFARRLMEEPAPAAEQGARERAALETCQRVLGFDLKRMIDPGSSYYNQAVRDAYNAVTAALRSRP